MSAHPSPTPQRSGSDITIPTSNRSSSLSASHRQKQPPTKSLAVKDNSSNNATTTTNRRTLTNTNSDKFCLEKNTFWSRQLYHISLHNGLYMLNRNEQMALTAAGWTFCILACVYLSVFFRGFYHGLFLVAAVDQENYDIVQHFVDSDGEQGGGLSMLLDSSSTGEL